MILAENPDRENIENKVAEIIDPEAYDTRTWDRDRQYKAIKKAEEILELIEEETLDYRVEALANQFKDDENIMVVRVDELTPLAAYLADHDYDW